MTTRSWQNLTSAGGEGRPSVVALGGGHGLAATLSALRRITDRVTAVVGVADDGGSSGRLRADFGVLPPGDLRMALAALCTDDAWGRTWNRVLQHRFAGDGDLAGHALGNLLITALWEVTGDPVTGLDWVATLLQSQGRVLPCSAVPLDIVADVRGYDAANPQDIHQVRGQVAVATASGQITRIMLEPADPPACPQALAAIAEADAIVMGPGSWYTSVLPHLLIPELGTALAGASAQRIMVLNLAQRSDPETAGAALDQHLGFLTQLVPTMRFDVVVADPSHLSSPRETEVLEAACRHLGATLMVEPVSYAHGARPGYHDPARLAIALEAAMALPAR
ncbi:MAG: uridine diphosphate-N-acetylglucosamine-binding protein YvcK [Actinomycetales bacterium]|nr:uridine diphosphate-N-acetylglucosamine-binding protein YvcK [Actinomycetales bacterium]